MSTQANEEDEEVTEHLTLAGYAMIVTGGLALAFITALAVNDRRRATTTTVSGRHRVSTDETQVIPTTPGDDVVMTTAHAASTVTLPVVAVDVTSTGVSTEVWREELIAMTREESVVRERERARTAPDAEELAIEAAFAQLVADLENTSFYDDEIVRLTRRFADDATERYEDVITLLEHDMTPLDVLQLEGFTTGDLERVS